MTFNDGSKNQEKGVPLHSNRGVQNTRHNGLNALVDWVSAIFPYTGGGYEKNEEKNDIKGQRFSVEFGEDEIINNETIGRKKAENIIDMLQLDITEFTAFDHGVNGYSKHLRRGHISLYYAGGSVDAGVQLIMTGQGCREYEQNGLEWHELFKSIFDWGAHFTRLDLAIDDDKGYFTVAQVEYRLQRKLWRSKFKSFRVIYKGDKEGNDLGKTIYLGSPQSDIKIRFYDKLKEREAAGKEVTVDKWVRTELEMKDKRADHAAQFVIDAAHKKINIGVVIVGILKNYVTFLEQGETDTNKARWQTWKKWERFIGNVEKIKLTKKAPDKTIDRSRAWIDNATPKTIAKLYAAYDGDLEWLFDVLDRGMRQLDKRDYEQIETYKRNNKMIDDLITDNYKDSRKGLVSRINKEKLELYDQSNWKTQSDFDSFDEYGSYLRNMEDYRKRRLAILEEGLQRWEQ